MSAGWRTLVMLLMGLAILWTLSGGWAQFDGRGLVGTDRTVNEAVEKLKSGDDQSAARMLDAFLKRRGNKAENYVIVAAACLLARRYDMVAAYAERGLKETPGASAEEHGRLHSLLGAARQQLGDYDRAIESHLAARHLLPADPGVLNNLAYAYAEAPDGLERLRDAERIAQEAIDIAGEKGVRPAELAVYLDTLGWIQLKLGKLDLALVNLTAAADALPEETDVMYHLARAYLAAGRHKEGRIMLQRMLRTDPKDKRAVETLRELGALYDTGTNPAPANAGIRASSP